MAEVAAWAAAQAKEAKEAREAAEVAEVQAALRISAAARALRQSSTRDPVGGGANSWSRLTRSRTDKTQVR